MRINLIVLAGALGVLAGIAIAKQPGPVIENLGPVVPTPMPSPKREEHIRLISSFTLGNRPDGDSVITFEAADYGVSGVGDEKKFRTIASEQYSLIEPKPNARDLRDQIMRKIRELESDMLRYVELVGPPRVREPISQQSGAARP
jgi:hypothetical protein